MIDKLLNLANILDKHNFYKLADEIEEIAKIAIELSPEREKELDEEAEKWFNDPARLRRDQVEKEYGLGVYNEEDDQDKNPMNSLDVKPWHGFELSYFGIPKGMKDFFKPLQIYHTIIVDEPAIPEEIDDKEESGVWKLEEIFDRPDNATIGKYEAVYRLDTYDDIDLAKRKKEREKDDVEDPEIRKLLDMPNEAFETTELPDDVVEQREVASELTDAEFKMIESGDVSVDDVALWLSKRLNITKDEARDMVMKIKSGKHKKPASGTHLF